MNEWLKEIKTWSFDLGNTLFEFLGNKKENLIYERENLKKSFMDHGIDVPQPDLFICEFQEFRLKNLYEFYEQGRDIRYLYSTLAKFLNDRLENPPSEGQIIDIARRSLTHRFSKNSFRMYESTKKLLEFLKVGKNHDIILISNIPESVAPGNQNFAHDLLEKNDLIQFFDHLIISGSLGVSKPNAEIFNRALDLTGLNSREIVHIGDDFGADIVGALKAGINTIWISDGEKLEGKPTEYFPNLHFSSIDSLYEWVVSNLG